MIESKLREYKSNLSKLKLIDIRMQEIETEIQLLDPSYISAIDYSGTPTSCTNKFHSPVETAVIEGEDNQGKINNLKKDLWQLAKDRLLIKIKVDHVNALLDGLTAEERDIIQNFFFEGFTWRLVADRYRREFGNYISRESLRGKKKTALKKMERNLRETKSPV